VRIPSSDAVSPKTLQVAMYSIYNNFAFFKDFPIITANIFITSAISVTIQYNFDKKPNDSFILS